MSELDGSPLTGDPRSPDVLALVAAIRPVRPLGAHPAPGPRPLVVTAAAGHPAAPSTAPSHPGPSADGSRSRSGLRPEGAPPRGGAPH